MNVKTKKVIVILSLMILMSCDLNNPKVYDKSEVKEIAGKIYEVVSDDLVTGKVIERYKDGQIKRELVIENGFISKDRKWRQEGQLSEVLIYEGGSTPFPRTV